MVEDMRRDLLAGADKISMNTAAVKNPEWLTEGAKRFGKQCIVLAIDAKRKANGRWEVYTHGGRTPTGQDAVEWARQGVQRGAGELLVTSMDRDGTGNGYDLDLVQAITAAVTVPVIASGGAGTVRHFLEVFEQAGADAALAATLFHDRILTIPDLKQFLFEKQIPVRILDKENRVD